MTLVNETGESDDRLRREAAVGRLAAGLWHETMNLLTVLSVWTNLLASESVREKLTGPAAQAPDKIVTALGRLTRLASAQHVCAAGLLKRSQLPYAAGDLIAWLDALVEPKLRPAGSALVVAGAEAVHAARFAGNPGEILLALATLVQRLGTLADSEVSLTLTPDGDRTRLVLASPAAAELRRLKDAGDPELELCARLLAENGAAPRFDADLTLSLAAPPAL